MKKGHILGSLQHITIKQYNVHKMYIIGNKYMDQIKLSTKIILVIIIKHCLKHAQDILMEAVQ